MVNWQSENRIKQKQKAIGRKSCVQSHDLEGQIPNFYVTHQSRRVLKRQTHHHHHHYHHHHHVYEGLGVS